MCKLGTVIEFIVIVTCVLGLLLANAYTALYIFGNSPVSVLVFVVVTLIEAPIVLKYLTKEG